MWGWTMRAAAAADARWGRESSQGEAGQEEEEEEEEEPLSVARNVQGEKRGVTKERKGGGCPILAKGVGAWRSSDPFQKLFKRIDCQKNFISEDSYTLVFKIFVLKLAIR